MMPGVRLVLLLALLTQVDPSSAWNLNEDRVLLPLTEEGASYKLFTDGGCFEWKSSRPEIGIETLYENADDVSCSSSARVTFPPKTTDDSTIKATITAEDV